MKEQEWIGDFYYLHKADAIGGGLYNFQFALVPGTGDTAGTYKQEGSFTATALGIPDQPDETITETTTITVTGGVCGDDDGVEDGAWEFGGCFTRPDKTDYDTTQDSQLDGLQVAPVTQEKTDKVDYGDGHAAEDVVSNIPVTVSLSLNGFDDEIWKGHLDWSLKGGSITLPVSKGTAVAGFTLLDALKLAPGKNGSVRVTGTTNLPPVLGGGSAKVKITSVYGKGVTAMRVSADHAVLGKLFSVTNPVLAYEDGAWTVTGTISAGTRDVAVSGTLSYDNSGALTSGSISMDNVALARLWNLESFVFSYTKSGGQGTWSLAGTTSGQPAATLEGAMTFGSTGAITAAHLDGTNLSFGSLFDLQQADLTYKKGGVWAASGQWGSAQTPSTFSGGLSFSGGSLTEADLTVKNVSLEHLFDVTSASLSISGAGSSGGGASWTLQATVAEPGKKPVTLSGKEVFDASGAMTTGELSAKRLAVAQLFDLDKAQFSYSLENGSPTWSLTATGRGSNGQTVDFTGSVTYNAEGVPTAGSFECHDLALASLITIKTFTLDYDPRNGWTGSAQLAQEQTGQQARVGLTIDNEGVLTSGFLDAQNVALFGVLQLDQFDLSYDQKLGWGLSVQTTIEGATVGTGLAVLDGAITEANLDIQNVSFAGKLTIDSLGLRYESTKTGGKEFAGSAKVTLPGPAGKTISGSFTFVDGRFTSGGLDIDGLNVALGYAIFLEELGASIQVTYDKDGNVHLESLSGTVGLTAGPEVTGHSAMKVVGDVAYDFPANRWDITGSVSVVDRQLGTGEIVVAQSPSAGAAGCPEPATAPFVAFGVTLGAGDGREGLHLGKLVSMHGHLCGTFTQSSITATGQTDFDIAGDTVSGNVAYNQNGLAACGSLKGHTGSYGFEWPFADSLPTPKLGDCSLTGF